jgi:hypothetical protein
MPHPSRTKDIAGQKFNRLTALTLTRVDERRRAIWLFRCDCGQEREAAATQVRYGHTTSCGCAMREQQARGTLRHGKAKSPAWRSWLSMRRRCRYGSRWTDYRGRGITVCERWERFEAFFEDMGDPPAGATLDRIDNARGYEPGNCRWASKAAQYANTTRTIYVQFHGVRVPFIDLVRVSGVKRATAHARMFRYGWTAERAFPNLRPESLTTSPVRASGLDARPRPDGPPSGDPDPDTSGSEIDPR